MIGYAFYLNLMWMAGPEYEISLLLLGISDRRVIWTAWSICMMELDTLAFVLDYTGIDYEGWGSALYIDCHNFRQDFHNSSC